MSDLSTSMWKVRRLEYTQTNALKLWILDRLLTLITDKSIAVFKFANSREDLQKLIKS